MSVPPPTVHPVNTASSSLDLTPLAHVLNAVEALRQRGWVLTDGITSTALTLPSTQDPAQALAQVQLLLPASLNVEAIGERGGTRLRVRLVNHQPEVIDPPVADPRELFDQPQDQEEAHRALDGDADAALRLPMQWRVEASFSFVRLLEVPAGVAVTVSLRAATITQRILSTTAVDVGDLLSGIGHRVMVALDATGTAALGLLVLTGVPAPGEATRLVLHPPALLPGEHASGSRPAPGALLPAADGPVPPIWREAAEQVRGLAAQLLWRLLATSEQSEAGQVVITFHGYKKSSFSLPAPAWWPPEPLDDTLALREWALHDASPDRLLAIRQVTSLYDTVTGPFAHASDIQASAEVIYTGLRTDAVAEAVKSSREAHAQAQDAARQTVKNATDMIKGATERTLAALVAVGAVLMANAGRVLPDDVSRLLIVLVAAFLLLLAAASVLLEGPLLALPAERLKADLVHQAGLLSDDQRDRIHLLPSLAAARDKITMVRFAVPFTHGTFALLLLVFAHPSRYS